MDRRSFLIGIGALALAGPALSRADARDAARTYASRDRLVAAIRDGLVPGPGEIHVAGGYSYAGAPGATALPDLPGFLPDGDIHVEHFGALGDLAFKFGAVPSNSGAEDQGFLRTAGTNDLAAFQAADAYAASSGANTVHVGGRYFLDGEFRPLARIVATEKYKPCIWTRYGVLESGFRFFASGSGLIGVKVIAQYDRTGSKPDNNGHLGNAITVGDYYTEAEQPLITGVDMDVLMCRAANMPGRQRSAPSIMMSYMGHVEKCRIALGVHGKTNVGSQMALLVHWGAQYDRSTIAADQLDRTSATILKTYHGLDLDISFLTGFDNGDGWDLHRPYELAAAGRTRVGPVKTVGLPAVGWVGCGDVCDAFTVESQKGAIGKGIEIGFAKGVGCDPGKASSFCGFFLKGRGGGKALSDVYDGTDIPISRQLVWDVKCEGFDLEFAREGGKPDQRGLWLNSCLGRIDLGRVSTHGPARAIENEYSDCDLAYSYVGGDGALLHEFSRGGRILESSTHRTGDKSAVAVIGRLLETKTTASVAAGATMIPIVAFDSTEKGTTQDVMVGNTIRIGKDQTVKSRALIQNGVAYLVTTPLKKAVPAGTPVVIDQRARLDGLVGTFETSGQGLVMVEAEVMDADLSRVSWSGPQAASLKKGSVLQLLKPPPAPLGAATLAASAASGIVVDRTSKVVR